MEVSAIRLVNIGKIRAIVDIRTSEGFTIKGFKVVEGDNGFFVGMPSERTKAGKYVDMVRVDEPELKEMLEAVALEAYEKKAK
jgi:stage V sporulation protein G